MSGLWSVKMANHLLSNMYPGITSKQLPVEGGKLLLGRLQLLRVEPQWLPLLPVR
jgi:hypothetical protein